MYEEECICGKACYTGSPLYQESFSVFILPPKNISLFEKGN